jgi:hypothetical protein
VPVSSGCPAWRVQVATAFARRKAVAADRKAKKEQADEAERYLAQQSQLVRAVRCVCLQQACRMGCPARTEHWPHTCVCIRVAWWLTGGGSFHQAGLNGQGSCDWYVTTRPPPYCCCITVQKDMRTEAALYGLACARAERDDCTAKVTRVTQEAEKVRRLGLQSCDLCAHALMCHSLSSAHVFADVTASLHGIALDGL